jgi:hypothetical protein
MATSKVATPANARTIRLKAEGILKGAYGQKMEQAGDTKTPAMVSRVRNMLGDTVNLLLT